MRCKNSFDLFLLLIYSLICRNHLKYKSILELGLFSTLLQELLEMESENLEQLTSLLVETRKLQSKLITIITLI